MRLRLVFPALFLCATTLVGVKLMGVNPQGEVDYMPTQSFKGAKETQDSLRHAFDKMSALEVARLLETLDGEELVEAAAMLKVSHLGDVLPLLSKDKAKPIMQAMLKQK